MSLPNAGTEAEYQKQTSLHSTGVEIFVNHRVDGLTQGVWGPEVSQQGSGGSAGGLGTEQKHKGG